MVSGGLCDTVCLALPSARFLGEKQLPQKEGGGALMLCLFLPKGVRWKSSRILL